MKQPTRSRPRSRPATTPWGEGLRSLLHERGLTQAHLARLAGIDESTVGHILRGGHCGTDTLHRIASALEVDMADLFSVPGQRASLAERHDRLVLAVLKELSDEVAASVAQVMERRRRRPAGPRRGERRLPFPE
jgi:transcriptional regulator with XRE-family HTH domain